MSKSKEFFDVAKKHLEEIKAMQHDQILQAAKMMGDCMETNGVVQLFGIGHGLAFSMELGYRAGGLMPFHQMKYKDLALRGIISEEQLHDPAINNDISITHKLFDLYNIFDEDMFILVSYAGNEPVLVETALLAKEKNQKIIAVVNKKLADESVAIHPSGKTLLDLADLVIDIMAPNPDTVITLSNGDQINQVSTICSNVIAQMLTAETYHYLKETGKDCPVLLSANVKGADVHNKAISDRYLGRWE